MTTLSDYIPLPNIPSDIVTATLNICEYFNKEGLQYWQFMGLADRRLVNQLERRIEELETGIKLILDQYL